MECADEIQSLSVPFSPAFCVLIACVSEVLVLIGFAGLLAANSVSQLLPKVTRRWPTCTRRSSASFQRSNSISSLFPGLALPSVSSTAISCDIPWDAGSVGSKVYHVSLPFQPWGKHILMMSKPLKDTWPLALKPEAGLPTSAIGTPRALTNRCCQITVKTLETPLKFLMAGHSLLHFHKEQLSLAEHLRTTRYIEDCWPHLPLETLRQPMIGGARTSYN